MRGNTPDWLNIANVVRSGASDLDRVAAKVFVNPGQTLQMMSSGNFGISAMLDHLNTVANVLQRQQSGAVGYGFMRNGVYDANSTTSRFYGTLDGIEMSVTTYNTSTNISNTAVVPTTGSLTIETLNSVYIGPIIQIKNASENPLELYVGQLFGTTNAGTSKTPETTMIDLRLALTSFLESW